MSDLNMTLAVDRDFDDLPLTLRREREARERGGTSRHLHRDDSYLRSKACPDNPVPAAVTRFDVPFVPLMTFFLKAVIAAIPALVLLGSILWFGGHILESQFPELVKMKILITFPNG